MPDDPSSSVGQLVQEMHELCAKARAGDQDACQQFFDRFHTPMLKVIRRNLHSRLRSILDSTDVTQMVWETVFADIMDGKEFASPAQFLAFLTSVAEHKTADLYRRHIAAQKRSLDREKPMADHDAELRDRAGSAQDPAKQAAAADDWAQRLAGLSYRDRAVLTGLQHGEVLEDLARRLGISVRSLRRIVERRLVRQAD